MEVGNVKFLEIKLGKIPVQTIYKTIKHGSTTYNSFYGTKMSRTDYGITFVLQNLNSFQIKLDLSFSKHTSRNEDGTFSEDLTPKFETLWIPADEKIKGFIKLGSEFPADQNDLRLQDVFLETILVQQTSETILGKSENAHIQVYSKDNISKVSTLTRRKLFETIVSGIVICPLFVFIMNDDSSIPFVLKLICFAVILYIILRTFKMWKRSYIDKKGVFSKIIEIFFWG